jgi:hypothetical protein
MIHGKPRGTTVGIEKYQVKAREKARLSLICAVTDLWSELPNVAWTNIDVCRRAGLKSSVALKKPWNYDILQKIRQHNSTVNNVASNSEKNKNLGLIQERNEDHRLELIIKKLRMELSLRITELNTVMGENRMLTSQLLRERKK